MASSLKLSPENFAHARRHMLTGQLYAQGLKPGPLARAFGSLAREHFVAPQLQARSYLDEHLCAPGHRPLLAPAPLALLLQAAAIPPGCSVLEIACGSGYATAVMARAGAQAIGLEDRPEEVARANRLFSQELIDTAVAVAGPLADGYPKQGPYDIILIAAAVTQVPAALIAQTAEGGQILTIERTAFTLGEAVCYHCRGGQLSRRVLFNVQAPELDFDHSRDTTAQENRGTTTQESRGTTTQENRDTTTQENRGTTTQENRGTTTQETKH